MKFESCRDPRRFRVAGRLIDRDGIAPAVVEHHGQACTRGSARVIAGWKLVPRRPPGRLRGGRHGQPLQAESGPRRLEDRRPDLWPLGVPSTDYAARGAWRPSMSLSSSTSMRASTPRTAALTRDLRAYRLAGTTLAFCVSRPAYHSVVDLMYSFPHSTEGSTTCQAPHLRSILSAQRTSFGPPGPTGRWVPWCSRLRQAPPMRPSSIRRTTRISSMVQPSPSAA